MALTLRGILLGVHEVPHKHEDLVSIPSSKKLDMVLYSCTGSPGVLTSQHSLISEHQVPVRDLKNEIDVS